MLCVQFFRVLSLLPSTWLFPLICISITCISLSTSASAQVKEPETPAEPIAPAAKIRAGLIVPQAINQAALQALRRTTSQLDLSTVVLAKYADGSKGPQLVTQVDNFRTEEREVTVTRMVPEKRTRTLKIGPLGNEKEVEQEYTVQVPVTEKLKREVQVPAAGKRLLALSWDEISIYRLDATPVTEADAKQLLDKMTPIFLLRNFRNEVKPIEGPMLQALNPNCLIVVVKPLENDDAVER